MKLEKASTSPKIEILRVGEPLLKVPVVVEASKFVQDSFKISKIRLREVYEVQPDPT